MFISFLPLLSSFLLSLNSFLLCSLFKLIFSHFLFPYCTFHFISHCNLASIAFSISSCFLWSRLLFYLISLLFYPSPPPHGHLNIWVIFCHFQCREQLCKAISAVRCYYAKIQDKPFLQYWPSTSLCAGLLFYEMQSCGSANEERPLIPHSSININGHQTFQETRIVTISRVTVVIYLLCISLACFMPNGENPKVFPHMGESPAHFGTSGSSEVTRELDVINECSADRSSVHSIATAIATIQSAFSSNIFLQLPQEKEQKRQWGGSRRLLVIVSYQTGATVRRRICGCDKTKVGAPSEEKSKLFLATGNPPVTQKGRRLQMFVYTTGRRKDFWGNQNMHKFVSCSTGES